MGEPTAIIVDDDPDLSTIFSELLEMLNLKILGLGKTGMDAISLVNELKPDIVFLDLHMPKLNGMEALKKIKNNAPKTHVIIITSDKFVDGKNMIDLGAIDIIFKPFNMDEIIKAIEKIKTTDYSIIKNG